MSKRLIIAALISVLPMWPLRRLAYRCLLGYRIDPGSRIAALTMLAAAEVEMTGARIGPFNLLRPHRLEMGEGSLIGRYNRMSGIRLVSCGPEAIILHSNLIGGTWGRPQLKTGREDLILGARSQLTIKAFVDLNDRVVFGQDVVAGGVGSQFWTHGFDHNRNRISGPIAIADRVFLGSASIVLPNVSICTDVTIGAGTNVHRSITEPGLYVSSELVRKA